MRPTLILFLCLASGLPAQTPLNAPAPLVSPAGGEGVSAGNAAATLLAAERAQALGFPHAAITLYRELLSQPDTDRAGVTLALITAQLDAGLMAEAQQTLAGFVGLRGPAWQLREGLVAAQQQRHDDARAALSGLTAASFVPADRGWFLFLQGMLADAAGDPGAARGWYEQAEAAAGAEQARARFMLAREQARLRSGPVSTALAEEARASMERLQGRKAGYGFARTYAVMLDALGRKAEAVGLLQRQLLTLPAEEKVEADEFRLLLGLIAGAGQGAGRSALESLLDVAQDRNKQRMALQLLQRAATGEAARARLRQILDALIAAATPHPILEDLLMARAEIALLDKNYAQTETSARELLAKFPGSELTAQAYGVLTTTAWGQYRYRSAADLAGRARSELAPGQADQTRARLGVLVAEAWYRARDFPNAAAAYAAVLDEVPEGIAAGDLMFQRVMADIEAGRLEVAEEQLDTLASDPRFGVVNRWQTEWNLARALQVAGRTEAAFARVNRLLSAAPAAGDPLPAELQARMRWLQARLSLEAGQPEQTLRLVATMPDTVTGIPDELRRQVMSSSVLLQAEALFRLDRREEAVILLQKLRDDYPGSDAAIYSFVIEAEYHAQLGQTVEAQRLYTKLADDFPNDERYASYALYQAALQAERRGQDSNFIEANRLIEDLVRRYPASPLVFYARLKQGDLLRKLNQFPQAQQVYETLVNNHTDHADVVLAQLALAECHNAQSLNDTNHAERAISLFENLRDRVDAPVEVRVEAGFNLGYLLLRTARRDHAEAIWWRDVVTAFLLDERMAGQLGAKGRYWMTRTLLELGTLHEQQARFEQAQEAWTLILRAGLPGRALARERLARYTTPANQP